MMRLIVAALIVLTIVGSAIAAPTGEGDPESSACKIDGDPSQICSGHPPNAM
jgi:hypothetical protein